MMNTRVCFVLVLATVAACKSDGPGNNGDDDDVVDGPAAPERGFQIVSPDITIPHNTEITYCYYFRTPNTEPMQISRWKSEMTPGSHHMIMFMTSNDLMPPGTVSSTNCGFAGGGSLNIPVWTYAAQTPSADLQLPADDGAGNPLAQDIAANSAAFFQFASGKLTYECTYNNPDTQGLPIEDGDSAATEEMCMASGYFFPATKPLLCYDGAGPF